MHVRAERGREIIDHAAAVAEAGDAELAGRQLVRLEKARAVEQVGAQLGLVEIALQGAAVVIVARVAADRRQPVGREREETIDGGAARDVLDIGIEAAVLVDHQHGRERPRAGRLDEVTAHGAGGAARRRIGHIGRLHALVGERDRLRLGVARQQRLRHRQSGAADDRDRPGAAEKLAPVHAPMAILVVEVEYALVDLHLGDALRHRAFLHVLLAHHCTPWGGDGWSNRRKYKPSARHAMFRRQL